VAAVAAVLLIALLATRSCAARDDEISKSRAIELARPQAGFTPDRVQIRYLQRGIPAAGFWAVSFYSVKDGRPDRVKVVLVNARTGAIAET